jgi:hypothetical protein
MQKCFILFSYFLTTFRIIFCLFPRGYRRRKTFFEQNFFFFFFVEIETSVDKVGRNSGSLLILKKFWPWKPECTCYVGYATMRTRHRASEKRREKQKKMKYGEKIVSIQSDWFYHIAAVHQPISMTRKLKTITFY